MKEVWVNADPWKKELVAIALEAGADAVVVSPEKESSVKELGLIKTVSEKGDLRWGKDVTRMDIQSAKDEERITELSKERKVIVRTSDWTIIPLENLLAKTDNLLVEVTTVDEARIALGILEKGVNGLVIRNPDPVEVLDIIKAAKASRERLELTELEIVGVHPVGMGDRVCVDTCSLMGAGEGILAGNSSRAMFLIQAESLENRYVAPRAFRVNAGAVHAYVMASGERTRYLSELRSGDEVLGVDCKGETRIHVIGRVKVERRPLLLVEARNGGGTSGLVLQNAETIRMVRPTGEPVSVLKLHPGEEVLGVELGGGRHFGHRVRETILEK